MSYLYTLSILSKICYIYICIYLHIEYSQSHICIYIYTYYNIDIHRSSTTQDIARQPCSVPSVPRHGRRGPPGRRGSSATAAAGPWKLARPGCGAKGVAGSRWEVEKPWLGGLLILGGGLIDRYIDNIGLILDNIIYLLIS